MTSGVSINRDTSSTRGRAGGSPLTPLQNNLIFCNFELALLNLAYNMFFPGQAVDSAYLHVSSRFKAPSGGGLGKPPANYDKKGRVS
jgi:hypothetical protein